MKIFIIITTILFFNLSLAQNKKKELKGVTLIESYTTEDYVQPDSILFASGGDWEVEKYYEILFKKLKKEFKKSELVTEFIFESNDSIPVIVDSFEEIELNHISKNQEVVCVFAISSIDSNIDRINKKTGQTLFINQKRIMFYDLYMILIELKTNRTLMKRRFNVEANEIFYSNNKKLAKAIAQEIKK